MIKWLRIFVFVLSLVLCCNPGEDPYSLSILFKSSSASQSLSVYTSDSDTALVSVNGYGRDNTYYTTEICLRPVLYHVVASDSLRENWEKGSYFSIKALNAIELLRGTCDYGGMQEFLFYPSILIGQNQDWLFSNGPVAYDWFQPEFDDSDWMGKVHGDFPPYEGSRFYRISTAVNTTAFAYSGAALFSLKARNVSSLYLNGNPIFTNLDTRLSNRFNDSIDQSSQLFQYSIPLDKLNNTIVVAVQSDSEVLFPVRDDFELCLVLVPESSSRVGDSTVTSAHHRDYYSNPLEDVYDSSRLTYWKSIGRYTDFVVTFNNNRFEYLNQYSITSAFIKDFFPVYWRVSGCTLVDDDWDCEILDERSDALWKGMAHTLSFPMNTCGISYQRYTFDFYGLSDEIWISEIGLFAISSPPEAVFRYPKPQYTLLQSLDMIDIAPIAPGYKQFTVDPSLPAGIWIDSKTGEIEGWGYVAGESTHTITAVNRITEEEVHTSITLTIVTCDSDHQLLEVRQISQLNSDAERWRLMQGNEFLGEGSGVNCGDGVIETSSYFCLQKGVFSLQRQLDYSFVSTRSGHLLVRLHMTFRKNMEAWRTVASLPFDQCWGEWSSERPDFRLDGCWSFTLNTEELAGSESMWMVNTDNKADPQWYELGYKEDWRWRETTMESLGRSYIHRLRHWITVDKETVEALDVILGNVQVVWIALNGKYAMERRVGGSDPVIMRVTADRLVNGTNLIAVMFTYFQSDSYSVPAVLLHKVMNREALWIGEDDVSIRSSSFVPYFPSQFAIDGNPRTYWRGIIENGVAVLTISFNRQVAMGVNGYCITVSSQSLASSPVGWKVHAKGTDRTWNVLQVQTSITFYRRGEKRCFPVVDEKMRSTVITDLEFVFVGTAVQKEIHIAELSVMTVAQDRLPLPSFTYPNSQIDYVVGVDFPVIETPCPLYTAYSTSSSLPEGVTLDSGDGRLTGITSTNINDTQVEIRAVAASNQGSTTINLNPVLCLSPFARVAVIITHTEAIDSYLSFSLWKDSYLLQESFVTPSGDSFNKVFCVEEGEYRLQFSDASNAGFLETTYELQTNEISLHHGYFNPGYSSPTIYFTAGLLFSRHTLWYFSVDGSEPPVRWFETVNPVHETWDTAYPGNFPQPTGKAQYYKTVMDVGSHHFDLEKQVAIEVQFRVRGGAVLYLNGHEVLRHRLPSGVLTVNSSPLRSFSQSEVISVVLPLQFLDLNSEVQIIAVELHDDRPREADFELWISVRSNGSKEYLEGEVSSDLPEGSSHDLNRIIDGQYYQFASLDGESAKITIDLKEKRYDYITDFCFYSSNHDGTYPHSVVLEGGVIGEDEEVKWTELFSTDEMVISKVAFGHSACFSFYNDKSFSLFRLQMQNPDYKYHLEVAELEFFAQRLDGFCEAEVISMDTKSSQFSRSILRNLPNQVNDFSHPTNLSSSSRTPSGQWRDFGCDELYEGKLMRYCESGEWTEVADNCLPKAPMAFHYSASVFYVGRRNAISFAPTVVGAELRFFADPVPEGLTFNNNTGEFSGVYKGAESRVEIYVMVSNIGGFKDTRIELYVVNRHEEWLLIIALLGVACLVAFIVYLSLAMRRNEEAVKMEAKMSHLDIEGVPKKMLPLLV